ncbi:MAG TPA: GNAT family N-acetyltransferase [Patescibacteria group bacterium]|nr:GNAT family N-acetyltransferase [Patescibacteria group bacterium]
MTIRAIQPEDNPKIAEIISSIMTSEFRADPATTILGDPALHTMYENYQVPRAAYYVFEEDGQIAGGCGIKQLEGSDENICELQRMFLKPSARGKGHGKALIGLCIAKAKEFGYDEIYLETLSQMTTAQKLYESAGFKRISAPKGNTGHGGCDVRMLLKLKE